MMSGPNTFDPLLIETTPGGHFTCPFSPPPSFVGGAGEYMSLMRFRYRNPEHQRGFREHLKAYQAGGRLVINGPFASEALLILAKIDCVEPKMKAG
jgi:hypothetical protein